MQSIKNLKPNYKGKFHQRYYSIINESRYFGTLPVICRSSLEHKCCIYFDGENSNVDFWASEPFTIPYKSPLDNKIHQYNVDFLIQINGQKVLIEVKPKKQLIKPTEPKKKSKKAMINYQNSLKIFYLNSAKISAMKTYAENNGYKFIILTEDDIEKMIKF